MTGSLLVLVILGLIFLIFRAVVLWYWNLDKIVELLKSIDGRLEALEEMEEKPKIVYPSKEVNDPKNPILQEPIL